MPAAPSNLGTVYNRVASQNLERLAALSDGIFAVAMTLLVLDLHVPLAANVHSERELAHTLLALAPRVLTYAMSFLTLGIFWAGQQTQLNHFVRTDRNLTWIHLAFLLTVTTLPFSTVLLGEFITYRLALLLYWFNILLLGFTLLWSWHYARRNQLMQPDVTPEISSALRLRILIAQSLYAIGAALCLISTYVSIGFIVMVQLNYAVDIAACLASRRSTRR